MTRSSALETFAALHGLLFKQDQSPDGAFHEYVYSPDMVKRYAYRQSWDLSKSLVLWVMLNPGTGETEKRRRNTLGRCKLWSKDWGFGGLLIGNIFATRTKSATQLLQQNDVQDQRNEDALRLLRATAAETVVAWGSKGRHQQRAASLAHILGGAACLGLTAKGEPRHPLYIPKSAALIGWSGQSNLAETPNHHHSSGLPAAAADLKRSLAFRVRRMFKFEWDDQKAASNLQKHGVSFDEAVSVFADALAVTFSDTEHFESEDRSRTYGISNKGRLLVLVHTERRNNVRIISARKATRYEKGIYDQG